MKVPQRSKYAALHTITMWDGVGGPGVVVDGVGGAGVGLDGGILGFVVVSSGEDGQESTKTITPRINM